MGGEGHALDGMTQIGHAWMRMRGGGEGEHPLRDVHADHFGGACLRHVRGELAHAAAEVEHPPSLETREKPHEVGVLGGLRPARSESLEA